MHSLRQKSVHDEREGNLRYFGFLAFLARVILDKPGVILDIAFFAGVILDILKKAKGNSR